jgi:hypothetical protein
VEWEPYATSKPWRLTTHGALVVPRYVYVAFKDSGDGVYGPLFDDIIYARHLCSTSMLDIYARHLCSTLYV